MIGVLKGKGIAPRTVPTTGQDATMGAMVNILEGYQCGTVYKPAYADSEMAVALATFLRAGLKPPASVLNGSVGDPANPSVRIPAALVGGQMWVDATNMAATVIKNGVIPAAELCARVGASVCASAGITP